MKVSRYALIQASLFALAGCENIPVTITAAPAPTVEAVEAQTELDVVASAEATPLPEVESKPILSTWVRTDGKFSIDLSSVTNLDTAPGLATNERALFVFSPGNICSAFVNFNGTRSTGTLSVTSSRSTIGSAGANSRYCDPLEGSYEYSTMSGDKLRLCRGADCQYWE